MISAGRNKGLVLVGVLWLVVLLSLIAVGISRKSTLDAKISSSEVDGVRCKWACRAGVERAIAVLNEDYRSSDSLDDLWSRNEPDFNNVSLRGIVFTVKVTDEAGKLNVNTATKEEFMGLEEITEEIANAIIDWRDRDDESQGGAAESGYYRNLPFGYEIRNGDFRTIRELLKVKGIDERLLYGEDTNLNGELDFNEDDGQMSPPVDNEDNVLDRGLIAYLTCYSYERNVDADGEKRVNINKADERELVDSLQITEGQAKWIVQKRNENKFDSIADLIDEESPDKAEEDRAGQTGEVQAVPVDMATFRRTADKMTVTDHEKIPGRVNVNTAPKEVLAALSGGGASGKACAESIVNYRGAKTGGMKSIAELLSGGIFDLKEFKKVADKVTVRSSVYTVRCYARADKRAMQGANLQSEAVVDRSGRYCRVLYWYQGPGVEYVSYGEQEE